MSRLGMSGLALVATLVASGCATGYETAQPNNYIDEGPTTIMVSNHNWSDMNIYLVLNGTRRRLGTVTSQSTEEFPIPAYALASSQRIYLLADPIGSTQTFLSEPIQLNPGQRAEWRLENSMALSSLFIR